MDSPISKFRNLITYLLILLESNDVFKSLEILFIWLPVLTIFKIFEYKHNRWFVIDFPR